jgi:hypothetical protein
MHISDVHQVLLVFGLQAERVFPLVYHLRSQLIAWLSAHLEDPTHHSSSDHRRALWEPPDQLIQEILGSNLQVDGVAAISNEMVQNIQR